MTGLVDWAASRARMVLAFVVLSLLAGTLSYVGLPKEGEPDIEVPALFVSVQFPGISAEDSEKLLVKVMETEFADLDGLKTMYGTAADNYAGVALEFEFGWDKTQTMADVRDAMNAAEADFPDGYEKYSISEFNFSAFPIVVVSLSGPVPERAMARIAKDLQDRIEALEPVLEAGIAGNRDEMVEVIIDPLQLEAYNVTATELIEVVTNNNQLIAADEIQSEQGSFAVKIPSSFDAPVDIYDLPVKTNGDRVITLGDLTDISLTFEPRTGTARFNGETSIALQVVKRKGFNIIDTVKLVEEEIALAQKTWPAELRTAITMETSQDQSRVIEAMVRQLEGSVLTAIALVMIVTLAALGIRPAFLVGFAIPTSFLLCFALLAVMGVAISNMVMFGLILAVGMLVDGAIVVVEYADKRIARGDGPMTAYVAAAKRMFWPVVTSTATTLCAFMPMLFWPGVPGQFMRMLPITLIFVLSASLLVALVYLPVLGGVTGRLERWTNQRLDQLRQMRMSLFLGVLGLGMLGLVGAGGLIGPLAEAVGAQLGAMNPANIVGSVIPTLVTVFLLSLATLAAGLAGMTGAIVLVLSVVALGRKLRHALSDINANVAARAPWCPPVSALALTLIVMIGLIALGFSPLTVVILGLLGLAAIWIRSRLVKRGSELVSSGY
ncbi:MAG: efflux RND transporter permease subunit, partial [Pseudomonadota bacterium]